MIFKHDLPAHKYLSLDTPPVPRTIDQSSQVPALKSFLPKRRNLLSSGALSRELVRRAYCEFIGRKHYKWFITLTFKNKCESEEFADASLRHYYNCLNHEVYGWRHSRNNCNSIQWIPSKEYNDDCGIHWHALICDITEQAKIDSSEFIKVAKATWIKSVRGAGYVSRCELIRNEAGAIRYITEDLTDKYNPLCLEVGVYL